MKKLKKRFKKLNNRGSSIIMVVVAVAFVGIIVGSLLSAAGYAYRLKLQNKNAKNNFYYVEQAMQEIYAGVGAHTIEEMKAAYAYTVENMVRFDPMIGTYITVDDATANVMFKKKFIDNILQSDYFSQGDAALAQALASYISNDTVTLDGSRLNLEVGTGEDGLQKITIKNVTLTRIQDYDNSTAGGTYVQTISTDIVISEPDFKVKFNNVMSDYSEIFEYALIGDMGVQIENNTGLEISGNIYAAADFYNKSYNDVVGERKYTTYEDEEETVKQYEYNMASVTAKNPLSTGFAGYANRKKSDLDEYLYFDGENKYSMYSGLYMSGSNVTIMADTIIVPGTVAVMDSSDLTVFGSAGVVSEVWADNIVLGGSSIITADKTNNTVDYEGSEAIFGGNLYVRDDTELNAKGSKLTLHGSYYGYGNSTSRDTRKYVFTVTNSNFMVTYSDEDGNPVTENRGHYNSSAILVNGEACTLDLSEAKNIFLAGRSYIELSKKVEGATPSEDLYTETFTYAPTYQYTDEDGDIMTDFVRDYKTAESISIKSNQMMYNVSTLGEATTAQIGIETYNVINAKSNPVALTFLDEFLPSEIFGTYIPYVKHVVEGKSVYLIDFETAYKILGLFAAAPMNLETISAEQREIARDLTETYTSVNDYSLGFAIGYTEHVKEEDETELRDIALYDEFDQGTVVMPNNDGIVDETTAANIYSSGAISTREGQTFTMIVQNDEDVLSELLSDSAYKGNYDYIAGDNLYSDAVDAFDLAGDLELEYNYMKWNLDHYDGAHQEKEFVNAVLTDDDFGEDDITPINKYLIMSKITPTTIINTKTSSGYKVIISGSDVVIQDEGSESITGIVIARGDVTFDESVKHFEGMIVSGGKIYIEGDLLSLTASPNVCRGVLRDCLATGDAVATNILTVFKEYENYTAEDAGGVEGEEGEDEEVEEAISIDNIDYSQVVSMTNWMKNVGGDYDASEEP